MRARAPAEAHPRWACAELLLAGALLVAGLTVPHVMFWAGATPWLAALGLLSVWWRGLAFGAVHVYQGLSGMVATGLTGLVLAGVYVGTGRNLWAASATHGVLDTAGFVLIYLGLYPGIT